MKLTADSARTCFLILAKPGLFLSFRSFHMTISTNLTIKDKSVFGIPTWGGKDDKRRRNPNCLCFSVQRVTCFSLLFVVYDLFFNTFIKFAFCNSKAGEQNPLGGSGTERLVSNLTGLGSNKHANVLLFVCCEASESQPVKLVTTLTVIFPLKMNVLCHTGRHYSHFYYPSLV